MPGAYDPNGPLRLAYLTYRGKPHVGGQCTLFTDMGHNYFRV
jgi:hypothetical protein